MERIVSFISVQNPLMLLLFGLSVTCVAVVLDRALYWLASAIRHKPISPEVYNITESKRKILIRQLQAKRRKHYLQEVLLAVLQQPDSDDYLSQAISEQVDAMSCRLGTLDLIAKVAPLVGILGTVIGIAVSFGGISAMVTASPAAISNGISVALRTTAYGLIISIIASMASAAYRKMIRRGTLKMGRIICDVRENHSNNNV